MNVYELAASLTLDDSDYTKKLNAAGKNAKGFGNNLKRVLVPAAKVAAAGIAAVSTAIIAVGKSAVEAYADFEQLEGGAKLMFGNAYDTVAKNASEAYKTVQMSQNEYLRQVNGFATGLKTALNGNEQAAAELADKIVKAEADVVAATGNSQEAVQNAFNGIMRSNFTMLDNLQLGITPTKEGFQEVIDKVNEWNETNGKATEYQMGNLADMQAALVDYVAMVGMSGYAHDEAAKTIQGSLASTKASWQNLLVAMTDGNSDVKAKTQELIDSVKTYVGNVAPVVWNYIKSIPDVFSAVADEVKTYATTKFNEIKEKIKGINWQEVGTKLINDITGKVSDIVSNVRDWFTRAKDEINSIDWEQAGRDVITLVGNAFTKIGDTFRQWFDAGKSGIEGVDWAGAGKSILDFISSAWKGLKKWAKGLWDEAVKGIKSVNWKQAGDDIKKAVGKAWDTLKSWAKALWLKAKTGIQDVDWAQVGDKVKTFIARKWDDLKKWASDKWKDAKAGIESVDWKAAGDKVKTLVSNAWDTLKGWATDLWGKAKDGIESVNWEQTGLSIATKIANAVKVIVDWMKEKFEDAVAKIESIEWAQLGSDIWGWIKDGLVNLVSEFKEKFTSAKDSVGTEIDWAGLGQSILDFILKAFMSLNSLLLNFFNAAWKDIKNINWDSLGENIRDFILDGLALLGEKMRGKAEEGEDEIRGLSWRELGLDILNAIVGALVTLPFDMFNLFRDGIYAITGQKELAKDAGRSALDAFMSTGAWGSMSYEAQQEWLKATAEMLDSAYLWSMVGDKHEDEYIEGISDMPKDVGNEVEKAASKAAKGAGRFTDAGTTAGKNFANGFSVAETEALIAISRIQKAIDNIKGKKITITADIKAGANAKVGSNGKITPMARAMDRGYIYRHATIFGYDHDNDTYQMAGDAGPEAVVGVHSLSNMIQESVNKAVGKTQSAMIGVLNKILDVMPKGDVVLDTGALVGGIAGEMNGELERLTAWSGGGRAL